MSSRVGGAALALAAAALLAWSLATSAWWSGHPTVGSTLRHMQDVYVGLHGGELCNTGGDGTCKALTLREPFELAGYAELGLAGLLALAALGLAGLTWTARAARKSLAIAVIAGAALSTAVAVALIVIGPSAQASVPLGSGLVLFGLGVASAVGAGLLGRRDAPLVRLRPPQPARAPQAPVPVDPAIDVLALFKDEQTAPPSSEEPLGAALPPPPPLQLARPASPTAPPPPPPAPPPPAETTGDAIPRALTPTTVPPALQAPVPRATPPTIAPPEPRAKPPSLAPPFRAIVPMPGPDARTKAASFPSITVKPPPVPVERGKMPSIPPPLRPVPVPRVIPPAFEPLNPGAMALRHDTQFDSGPTNADTAAVDPTDTNLGAAPDGDRTSVSVTLPNGTSVPLSTAPDSLPPPKDDSAPAAGPTPACPQCEAPMAWVDEHLRFYCKSCRMYF